MVKGREYYENGHLRFEGEYNKGPRHYYGPRYFVKGKLYRESGELWFEGSFRVYHSFTIGSPIQKFPVSFAKGMEYDREGYIKYYHKNLFTVLSVKIILEKRSYIFTA